VSNAGELFLCAFPAFPNYCADDYLSNKKNQDDSSEVRSKELGNDEAEPKRAGNHNRSEEPYMPGGAGDEGVAVEKHCS
jgi:hypothetical protein